MKYLICALTLSLFGSEALAADSTDLRFAPPLMGFVFDRGLGQIRTVVGIPGAARVADPVKLESKLEHGFVAPGGILAIASVSGGSALTVVTGLEAEPSAVAVENSMADFDFGSFNAAATAAAVYGSACKCIQVIGGFSDAPRVIRNIDAASLPGAVISLAISDDQTSAAVAVAASEDGSSPSQVLFFDLNSDGSPVSIVTAVSSLSFTPSTRDLMVTDAPSGLVSLAQNGGGVADVAGASVSAGDRAVANPSAVAFTIEGILLLADRAGLVHLIDLQKNERRSVECSCRPNAMERMKDKSIYRLTGTEAGSVWILDLSGAEPRTLFVPIDQPAEGAQ